MLFFFKGVDRIRGPLGSVLNDSSLEVKQPVREANFLLPSSVEYKHKVLKHLQFAETERPVYEYS